MIYEYAFANEYVHVQPKSSDQDLRLRGARRHQTVISLLMTCHLIRKEATSVFNDFVTYDLTPYYNCMAAVYELGPGVSSFNESNTNRTGSRKEASCATHLGTPADGSYRHLLPSLQRVSMKHSPVFGLLVVSHDVAVRVVRLYFGSEDLDVRFVD
jgi:hypothetical protein